ncbi:hypothetical protein [Nostoc sphaeroides]|uniref:Uncharacterized protein n=1 Tax=Nostoc sphaeroides CCNUC1 TaxID=2653204 RepID=A0A5P8VVH8_9NOSO|nr:hypothetical protein [Nostoc sphaeroides]MCC5628754.1 hypothetical protein [Nostoc sphaeroides CHAB 2801]QFS44136.1 hypothetical protein GXM_01609 [Nostoc sphaeroides CCNUC1]
MLSKRLRYKPKLKTASKSYWGSKLLAGQKIHKGDRKCSPGQLALPIGQCQVSSSPELAEVVQKFVLANRDGRFDVRV